MSKENDEYSLDGFDMEALAKVKIPRKFEIYVEEYTEEDMGGRRAGWYPVKNNPELGGQNGNPVITITSKADLDEKQATFKQVGQRFKIIREVNPPTREQILKAAEEQGIKLLKDQPKDQQHDQKEFQSAESPDCKKTVSVEKDEPATEREEPPKPKQKPKIIQIGDTQIKYDGDKVYQKQWIRLTPSEQSNFRLVNDASNKIVSMQGKHIEARRWVMVEAQPDSEDETENIING